MARRAANREGNESDPVFSLTVHPYHLTLDPAIQIPRGGIYRALRIRLIDGATEDELAEAFPNRLPELFYALQQLRRRNAIRYQLRVGDELLATVCPIPPGFEFTERPAHAAA